MNSVRHLVSWSMLLSLAACASSSTTSGPTDAANGPGPDDGGAGTTEAGDSGSAPTFGGDAGSSNPADGGVVVTTTIYANTDDSLYAMDPQTRAVTLIGKFAGMSGGTNDSSITDCAVDGSGDVYVNTESVVYKATLPQGSGTVQLTKIAAISTQQGQRFYALAFAPAGVLGPSEVLIGGDGTGELWSIDSTNGTTKHLGSFGKDPADSARTLALSGDIVFYTDANNKPTGIATIRSCASGGTSCDKSNDFLAGIDMTALTTAFTSGTPAASLLAGIYGGSGKGVGAGTGYGELFGLGAWEGNVYAFEHARSGSAPVAPALISIDATSGKGQSLGGAFNFTNGWSGAGVTTKVTINLPPPPPPPK